MPPTPPADAPDGEIAARGRSEAAGEPGPVVELTGDDLAEVSELLDALRRWHRAAEAHSAASREYMRLGENDMRAIRYILATTREQRIVTSTMLADHLGITGPSITKMLDRLERGQHLRREPHPSDRRALSIVVTDATRQTAVASVGRDHARRFAIACSMTSGERRIVTRFLCALADLPVLDHRADPGSAGAD